MRAQNVHGQWSSRLMFILAAAGSAVGLGNIWKFPYITGEYGGGAFVLVYLLCIALIGLPIMMAEILIGRRGGKSPVGAMAAVAAEAGRSRRWRAVGWLGVLGALAILSFYSVVAGWALAYLGFAATGEFTAGGDAAAAMTALFEGLLASPGTLLLWHALFMGVTVFVVARGVRRGLEWAVQVLMPGLFLLLAALLIYSALSTDSFVRALAFLFRPNFAALAGGEAVLVAMGHAFFSLSLGLGVMMAYGSYLPRGISISRAALIVAVLDTLVALAAGLVIFPLVFDHGLAPGAGPGLIFVSLPIAFAQMPFGSLVGGVFFLFLFIAALTSAISLLEPAVEYLSEERGVRRPAAALATGALVWLLGVGSALSFNLWADFKPFGRTVFDLLDFLTTNIVLPVGGLLVAVFVGWALSRKAMRSELADLDRRGFLGWRFVLRYLTPVGVVLLMGFGLLR